MYSLIETAKLNGLNPQAYLADVSRTSPTTRPNASANCCPGIGNPPIPSAPPPEPGSPKTRPLERASPAAATLSYQSSPSAYARAFRQDAVPLIGENDIAFTSEKLSSNLQYFVVYCLLALASGSVETIQIQNGPAIGSSIVLWDIKIDK
jgi:hypothetical protein